MDTQKKIRILKGIDVKKIYKLFATLIFSMLFCTTRAFAAGTDPLAAINNLSTFVFAAIKAVGVIILGWGVVQIGLGVQGHDPTQKSNGFLSFFGGLIIAFAKEILDLILWWILSVSKEKNLSFESGVLQIWMKGTKIDRNEEFV